MAIPSESGDTDREAGDRLTDAWVGWTLLVGLLMSIAVMALGLLVTAVQHGQNASRVLPLNQVLPQVAHGNGPALLDLGILLLFATPLIGVVVALTSFVRRRDAAFVAVSGLLLVLLAAGFLVALR